MTVTDLLARLKEAHSALLKATDERVSALRAQGLAFVQYNTACDREKQARNRVEDLEKQLLQAVASESSGSNPGSR